MVPELPPSVFFFSDGALGSETEALRRPYVTSDIINTSGAVVEANTGILMHDLPALTVLLAKAHGTGFRVGETHHLFLSPFPFFARVFSLPTMT
jgi:hypothetical protein